MHTSSSRAQHPARQTPRWYRLRRAVTNVRRTLKELAELGYSDPELYLPDDADARAESRSFGKLIPELYLPDDTNKQHSGGITIGDLSCEGMSIRTDGIVWIGKGPQPDFEDPAFWWHKYKELNKKVWQLEYGLEGPPPGLGRIRGAILEVSKRLGRLAELGRSGQWILHNEDLYDDYIDTRLESRKPDEVFPIRGLNYKGVPIEDHGLVWAGKGQRPDFEDPVYWESKDKELGAKIQQVEDGHVRPEFTPEELRTLESMERQKGHRFRTNMIDRKNRLQQRKDRVLVALRELALLGRPGQWILHHEELYDPEIDTRPQTRKPDEEIHIRGFIYKGKQLDNELLWAGKEQPPDFEDLIYWERKADELVKKVQQVKDGQVQDQFTPEEALVLESMERDEDHLFCEAEKRRREEGEERRDEEEDEEITPSSRAAAERLKTARMWVWAELVNIADEDLPGMWVLRHQDIYLPEHHIYRHDQENTMAIPPIRIWARLGLGDATFGLRYDGDWPPPDFDDIAYWESKLEELRAEKEEVKAGRVKHEFTKLEQLQLLDSERESLEAKNATQKMTDRVNGWLRRENDPQAQPGGMQYHPDPQITDVAPTDVSGDSQATWPSRPSSCSASISRVGSSAAATENFSSADSPPRHSGRAVGPPNGSQRKRPGEPLPTTRRAKCRRGLRSDAAPAASGMPCPPPGTEDRLRPPRTGAVKRKLSLSGRLPAPSSQPAPRRSARIAALPPKKYR
jgi:hypothetical protein